MKAIQSSVLLASLAYGVAALAQAQATTTATPSKILSEQSMTKAEKIKQLKPATNYVELMQLLNTIHKQVLLTDPSFIEDENIHRLFGDGVITERRPFSDSFVSKGFTPSKESPFQFPFRIVGANDSSKFGSIQVGDYKTALPINYELVETYLMPGVQGENPYDPMKPMTNEVRNIAGGLPLAKHPKGYWEYTYGGLQSGYRNSIYVALDLNSNALTIDIKQNEE